MTALFDQGFFVREPAWHGLGIVLDDYPSRDEAMSLAGHDWDVVTLPFRAEISNKVLVAAGRYPNESAEGVLRKVDGWTVHVRSDNLATLNVRYQSKESYVKRTLLTDNPAKANLQRTIRELVAA